MLYLVGAGLGSIKDLTLRGYEIIQKSENLYIEAYTSIMSCGISEYQTHFGKEIKLADRELIEENTDYLRLMGQEWLTPPIEFVNALTCFANPHVKGQSDEILEKAKNSDVALIIVGDPLGATTHCDLCFRAKQKNIKFEVIHNASILTAVSDCGLQLYKFGETVSIVTWTETWKPESFYDKIYNNWVRGLHTLCLLGNCTIYAHLNKDIKLNERNLEKMMRNVKEYDPPFFLTAQSACAILLEINSRRKSENVSEVIPVENLCVLAGRLGWPEQVFYTTTIDNLAKNQDYSNNCPQSLIIISNPSEIEMEFLQTFTIVDSKSIRKK